MCGFSFRHLSVFIRSLFSFVLVDCTFPSFLAFRFERKKQAIAFYTHAQSCTTAQREFIHARARDRLNDPTRPSALGLLSCFIVVLDED